MIGEVTNGDLWLAEWQAILLAFAIVGYATVVVVGNMYVYSERKKLSFMRLSDRDTYVAFKWIYLWPLLACYYVPRTLLMDFCPFAYHGFRRFTDNYCAAIRFLFRGC